MRRSGDPRTDDGTRRLRIGARMLGQPRRLHPRRGGRSMTRPNKKQSRMRSDIFYTKIGAENRFSIRTTLPQIHRAIPIRIKKYLPTAYISKQAAVCVDYPFRSIIKKRRSKSIGKALLFP